MKRRNENGFTMAELLIVVAIIAVLVAVAIPTFTAQLEKSREGTDLANIRSAYAEAMVNAMSSTAGSGTSSIYPVQQQVSGWDTEAKLTDNLPTVLKTAVTSTGTGTWDGRSGSDRSFSITVTLSDGALSTVTFNY